MSITADSFMAWDNSTVIFFTIIATGVWLIANTEDFKKQFPKSNAYFIGSIAAVTSALSLGLFALVPLGLFYLFSWVLTFWWSKTQDKKLMDSIEPQIDLNKVTKKK